MCNEVASFLQFIHSLLQPVLRGNDVLETGPLLDDDRREMSEVSEAQKVALLAFKLGVGRIGRGEHAGALGHALLGQAEVHVVGREQAEAAVVMFGVVPGEEVLAVGTRVLDRAEAVRERRPVLERLELRFRKRVVGMSAMRVLRFASAARAGSVSKPSSLWCVSRDWLRTS